MSIYRFEKEKKRKKGNVSKAEIKNFSIHITEIKVYCVC